MNKKHKTVQFKDPDIIWKTMMWNKDHVQLLQNTFV